MADENNANTNNGPLGPERTPEQIERERALRSEMERHRAWAVGQVIGTALGITGASGKMTAGGARRYNDFRDDPTAIIRELRKRVIDPMASEEYRRLKEEDVDDLALADVEKIFEPHRTRIESRRNAIEESVAKAYGLDERERRRLRDHIDRAGDAELEMLESRGPEARDRYLAENSLVPDIETRGPKMDKIMEELGIVSEKDQKSLPHEDKKLLYDVTQNPGHYVTPEEIQRMLRIFAKLSSAEKERKKAVMRLLLIAYMPTVTFRELYETGQRSGKKTLGYQYVLRELAKENPNATALESAAASADPENRTSDRKRARPSSEIENRLEARRVEKLGHLKMSTDALSDAFVEALLDDPESALYRQYALEKNRQNAEELESDTYKIGYGWLNREPETEGNFSLVGLKEISPALDAVVEAAEYVPQGEDNPDGERLDKEAFRTSLKEFAETHADSGETYASTRLARLIEDEFPKLDNKLAIVEGVLEAFRQLPAARKKAMRDRLAEEIIKDKLPVKNPDRLAEGGYLIGKSRRYDAKGEPETNAKGEPLYEAFYLKIADIYSGGASIPEMRVLSQGRFGMADPQYSTEERINYNDFLQILSGHEAETKDMEFVSADEMERRIKMGKGEVAPENEEDAKNAITGYEAPTDILTFDALLLHLNEFDKGPNKDLVTGTSFQYGDPKLGLIDPESDEDQSGKFGVRVVQSIDQKARTITFTNGQVIDFTSFLGAYKKLGAKRTEYPMNAGESVIPLMKSGAPEATARAWDTLEYDAGLGAFREKTPEKDKEPKKVNTFLGTVGEGSSAKKVLIELKSINGEKASFNVYHDFDEKETGKQRAKGKKDGTKKKAESYEGVGLEIFYWHLRATGALPAPKLSGDGGGHGHDHGHHYDDIHQHKDRFQKWMKQWSSVSDMKVAFKKINKFIKHKFEATGTLNGAKLADKFVRNMPFLFTAEDKLEFQADVQSEVTKQMNATIEQLSKNLSGANRRDLIVKILLSDASTRPEIMAALLVALEKGGGVLYAASGLRDYEGTGLFFKRLAGIPLHADHTKTKLWQDNYNKAKDANDGDKQSDKKSHVTEIEVIYTWMKSFEGGAGAIFPPNYHAMILGKWAEGRKSDTEKGKREADNYGSIQGRLDYAYAKARDGEWMNALGDYGQSSEGGSFGRIIAKGGTGYENGMVPFMAIMGNAPETNPPNVFNKAFNNTTLAQRWNYPPLMFMGNRTAINLYRDVVHKIVMESGKSGERARDLLAKIENARTTKKRLIPNPDQDNKKADEKMVTPNQALCWLTRELWKAEGPKIGLMEKLNLTQDRTLITRRNEHPYGDYIKHVEGIYGNDNWREGPNQSEIINGTMGAKHTPPRVDVLTSWVKFDAYGNIQDGSHGAALWTLLKTHIDAIRTAVDPAATDKEKENPSDPRHVLYRKKRFAEIQHMIAREYVNKFGGAAAKDPREFDEARELIDFYGFDERLFLKPVQRRKIGGTIIDREDQRTEKPYLYAEEGHFDQYIREERSAKTLPGEAKPVESRSFEERFARFMGKTEAIPPRTDEPTTPQELVKRVKKKAADTGDTDPSAPTPRFGRRRPRR